jgi:hypothetical protein
MNNTIFVVFDYKYIFDILTQIVPNYNKIFIEKLNNNKSHINKLDKLNKDIIKKFIKGNYTIYFIGGMSSLYASFFFSKKIKSVFLFLDKIQYDDTNQLKKHMKKGLDYYTYVLNNNQHNVSKQIVSKVVYSNCIEYPFYNIYYKFDKKHILSIIKKFKPIIYTDHIPVEMQKEKFDKYDGKYFIMKDDWLTYKEINSLTDYFSENIRIKCSFSDKLSPLDYWSNNKGEIIEEMIKGKQNLSIYNIHELLFKKTRFCNNFRISVCITVLQHFKAKKWLDISAGWGDRLLSGILYKIDRYVAADPNIDLHPCYENMIKTFIPKSKRDKITIHKSGFEDCDLKDELFDIVFSSPPFFTLEKYSKYDDNSITRYKNEKIWVEKFFIKSLIKCYNHLEKDGHMVLYMGGSPYVFEQMFKLNNVMNYIGKIYWYDDKPRGIYVWKKIIDNKIDSL